VYLRARWYEPGVGIFSSPDPFPGLKTQPFSLQSYAYVLANPVNATDPSGWYHSDVHYDLTRQLVLEMTAIVAAVPSAELLGELIALSNQYVDQSHLLWPEPAFGCIECHFCEAYEAVGHVRKAVTLGNPVLFGAALHQYQDWHSHWSEGYRKEHATTMPSWKGIPILRTRVQTQDFYEGWHISPLPPHFGLSPYPPHPVHEVLQDIYYRNPGFDLNELSDPVEGLIDLYLRKDGAPDSDPAWQQREQKRHYFGHNTDLYVPSSTRDTYMRNATRAFIREFLITNARPCTIDFTVPSDAEIKVFLTEP